MEKPERKTFFETFVDFFWKMKESKMWKNQKKAHKKEVRETRQSQKMCVDVPGRQNMDTKWMEKETIATACVGKTSIVGEKNGKSGCWND